MTGDLPTNPGAGARAAASAALHEPFRPRRARRVAWVLAALEVCALVTLSVLLPATGPVAFHWYDRLGILVVAALVAVSLSRFAGLAAIPDAEGLRVRNVLFTRRLAWAQIVSVRFGGGQPWVLLDLSDGDTLAVMAVQRADGERSGAEARRLATLVALHSRTERDD